MQQVLDNMNNIASLPYISIAKRDQFSNLFILNFISLKITPLINILKIDYITKTKIIENTENRNINSKVNSNKLFNESKKSNNNNSNSNNNNNNNSNNSNSNNNNNNNNLSNPGDIYCKICRTSMCRLL